MNDYGDDSQDDGEEDSPMPEESLQSKAIRIYLKTGSLAATARQLETPVYQLQKLAKTQSWQDELGLLRRVEQAVLDTTLTEIMGMALTELKDRLVLGEEIFDSNGGAHMRPVSATTLVRIMDVVFDKRQLIRGLPTALTNEGSKLSELAAKLEELGRQQAAKTIEAQPAEGSGGQTFRLDED